MEVDIIYTNQIKNGETLTTTSINNVDGLTILDAFVNAGILNQLFTIATTASLLRTIFITTNQAVTIALNGANAVQTVTLGSPSAGTFTLTWGGNTTSAIAYNASAAVVQTAFTALASVGAGNATVTGNAGGPYAIAFTGTLALGARATLTFNGAGLTGGSMSVAVTVTGAAATSTLTMAANSSLVWSYQDGFYANPLSTSLTRLSISNSSSAQAKVSFRFGQVAA